jgi:hypothetical protein
MLENALKKNPEFFTEEMDSNFIKSGKSKSGVASFSAFCKIINDDVTEEEGESGCSTQAS